MINFFKKIKQENSFNFLEGTLEEVSNYTFKNIENRVIDGVIIKSVLSNVECNKLINNLKIHEDELSNLNKDSSYTVPPSFGFVNNEIRKDKTFLKRYIEDSSSFIRNFKSLFGIDINGKLKAIVEKLNPNEEFSTIKMDDKHAFLPGCFRIQHPKKCQIGLHCGNQFNNQYHHYYDNIDNIVETHNQLSYFFCIQEAEEGGALIVYDLNWADTEDTHMENHTATLKNGKQIDVLNSKKIKRRKLQIEQGDLLIFCGGSLYHSVEQVYGLKNRITYGGFFGFSKHMKNNKIYAWS